MPSTDPAQDHGGIIIIDALGDFYPPAAYQCGIAMDRLIVIRTKNEKDAFWAVDQSLRCPGVATVVASLTGLDDRLSRRLQLAAERSGCVGLILEPARRRGKSFAAVQTLVEGAAPGESARVQRWKPKEAWNERDSSMPSDASRSACRPARRVSLCRITLLTVREGTPAGPLTVDLQHETGALPLHPFPVDRSVAKTG